MLAAHRVGEHLLLLRGLVVAADALREGLGEQVVVEPGLNLLLDLVGGGGSELEHADPDGGEDPRAGGGQLLGVGRDHPGGDLGGEDGPALRGRAVGVIVGHVVGGFGLHQQQSVGPLRGGDLVLGEPLEGLGRLAGRAGHKVLGRHDPVRSVHRRRQGLLIVSLPLDILLRGCQGREW